MPPSYRELHYGLRHAKNIERKMLCEAFARLAPIASPDRFRYVGFGSPFFNDFALVHQSLGIRRMVSIEKHKHDKDRFLQNKPYRCIRMHWGQSNEVLPELSWRTRSIVWLDYDGRLDTSVLEDIETVVGAARSGSMLVVTVNAHPARQPERPADLAPGQDWPSVHEFRLARLHEDVDQRMLPPDLQGGDLAGWGTAKLYRTIILKKVEEVLRARNAPLNARTRIGFEQVFHFHYADGAKMLTVGGLLASSSDREKLGDNPFQGLGFIRDGEDPCLIDPPVLTSREVGALKMRLPQSSGDLKTPSWITERDLRRFRSVYRYYPTFSEAEL